MEKCFHFIDILSKACMWLAVFGLFSLSALVTIATLSRYFFNMPILGVDEISGYLNLLIGMLAIAYTLQKERHVQVDIVARRLPTKIVRIMGIITTCLALILVGQFIRSGLYTWAGFFSTDERSQTFLRTPLWWPYGFMLIGWFMFLLVILVHLVKAVAKLREPLQRKPQEGVSR